MEYTLSQVIGVIKHTFDEFFSEFNFWCTAEILSCKTIGKNTYLELIEYDEDHNIIAKIRGNIFKPGLLDKFLRETKLQPHELVGQKILFQGRTSFHKDYGISLLVNILSSTYTIGLTKQAQQDILSKLQKEGIDTKNKQLYLPDKPLSLAIISGETAAGLEDFLHILQDSQIQYTSKLFPATVQGNAAKESVLLQLQNISAAISLGSEYDLVCIVRGGGESGGIAWQNDIDIARAICLMPTPVMVAIGHTQDVSVLESISWKYAKTPSEAAFYVLQHYEKLLSDIENKYDEIKIIGQKKIESYKNMIQQYYTQITYIIPKILRTYQERIEALYTNILAYDPHKILQKGYALVYDEEGQMIKGEIPGNIKIQEKIKPGDHITIQMSQQTIKAVVEDILDKQTP